jgi:hypothetical protein
MQQQKKKNGSCLFSIVMMGIIGVVVAISGKHTDSGSSNEYVAPYHTRAGKFVKGHVRKSVSTSPNAVKRQNYSKAYYQRHKSRYTKSKKE